MDVLWQNTPFGLVHVSRNSSKECRYLRNVLWPARIPVLIAQCFFTLFLLTATPSLTTLIDRCAIAISISASSSLANQDPAKQVRKRKRVSGFTTLMQRQYVMHVCSLYCTIFCNTVPYSFTSFYFTTQIRTCTTCTCTCTCTCTRSILVFVHVHVHLDVHVPVCTCIC